VAGIFVQFYYIANNHILKYMVPAAFGASCEHLID